VLKVFSDGVFEPAAAPVFWPTNVEKEANRTTKSLEFQPIGRQMIDTLRVVDKVGVGEGNLPR
jgi:hypothetical protein